MRDSIWAVPNFSEDEEQTYAATNALIDLSKQAHAEFNVLQNSPEYIQDAWRQEQANKITAVKTEIAVTKLFNKTPGITLQDKLLYCNMCNCCDRHKINRPSTFKKWIELPVSNLSCSDKLNMCQCECRHTARFICRTLA